MGLTDMITDQIGLHSVLSPYINVNNYVIQLTDYVL